MANSKYEYVRNFERDEILLPNTWIVVRVDGRGFHKLSDYYHFAKPNDARALTLMNRAAAHVVRSIPEIVVAYGVSDEFSFVFHRSTTLFERRAAKIVTTVVSSFTAAYVLEWSPAFQEGSSSSSTATKEDRGGGGAVDDSSLSLDMLPTFDGRAVCYPSWDNLRDYLSWRQVDCHINNLYNTTFWTLVQQGGMTHTEAEEHLKGTVAADKNEILFSRFGINYNNEAEMFRKGSVVYREYALESAPAVSSSTKTKRTDGEAQWANKGDRIEDEEMEAFDADDREETHTQAQTPLSRTQEEKMRKARRKARVVVSHVDIIRDEFWTQRPWIRSGRPGRPVVS